MLNRYWPLFDLRVRTPTVELRPPTDAEVADLATLAAAGIHDPASMPFSIPWTDQKSPQLERGSLQHVWRSRAEWTPEKWSLIMAVASEGRLVGVQEVNAAEFVPLRRVETGSWLGRAFQGKGIGKEMRAAILHLAFAGLGVERALSGAWTDNARSVGVSRALGYVDNGTDVKMRRDSAERQIRFLLERDAWERARRDDIVIEGLDPCLDLFGLD